MSLSYLTVRLAHYLRENPLLIVLMVGALLGLVLLVLPVPLEQIILAPQGETDRFLFGGSKIVGQEFNPPKGLSQIRIPVGTTSEIRGPLILHLRQDLNGKDIRSQVVFSVNSEEATFSFPILFNPPPTLFWVLEAPHSPTNSFWVYREKDASKSVGTAITGSTRIVGNFGFTLVQRLPVFVAWLDTSPIETHANISQIKTWEWFSLLFGSAGVVGYCLLRRRKIVSVPEGMIVAGLIVVSFVTHIGFVVHLPLVNDEGAYIQDILQAKPGFLPLREYLAKGPAYLGLLKIWQLLIPHTIVAWRLFATVSWSVAIYVAWRLTLRMKLSQSMRMVSITLMAISPAVIALTTPLLLQTTSVPIMLLAILAGVAGSQENRRSLIVVSSLLVTMAFFVRVSSIIGGLITFLCIAYYARRRLSLLTTYVGVGVGTFLLIFLLAVAVLGFERSLVSINAEALLISSQRAQIAQAASTEPLIRQLTHEARLFWRGAPWLILGLFTAPLLFINRQSLVRSSGILLALLGMLYLVYFHLSDANYLLPAHFSLVELVQITTVFGGVFVLIVASLTASTPLPAQYHRYRFWLSIIIIWLVLLAYLYLQWGRFRQSYLVEFIPPLILLSGITLVFAWQALNQIKPVWLATGLRIVGVFLMATMLYQGTYIVWQYPHTGSIAQDSFRHFIIKTQQVVPPGEVIFTAQPNVTAFSLRPIVFGNSHPGWYREARFGTIPERLRDLFFVHPDQVTRYLKTEAKYVVMERRTDEIYFDGYPERRQILQDHFTKVVSIDNEREGEPLELYERSAISP